MDTVGFLLLKDYFDEETSKRITRWGDEIEEWEEMSGKWMIYNEQSETPLRSRIENFIGYHPELEEFVNHKIKPLLEKEISRKVHLFKDKMNWKRAGGKGFAPHQDHPAWSDFPSEIFWTVALFVDSSTEENGCLEFSPFRGNEILEYDQEGNGGLIGEFDWKTYPTTPSDILIFNSFTPHRSGPNLSDGSRRIFYFTYNPSEDGDFYREYNQKKREELPPDIEREEGKEYKIFGNKYNLANPIV